MAGWNHLADDTDFVGIDVTGSTNRLYAFERTNGRMVKIAPLP